MKKSSTLSRICVVNRIFVKHHTIDLRLNEHKNSFRKGDIITTKLAKHAHNEDHIFEWENATQLARKSKRKARNFYEIALTYMGGDQLFSAPCMYTDPI
jgi:hypothetical protein